MATKIIEFATGYETDEVVTGSITGDTVSLVPSGNQTESDVQAAVDVMQSGIDGAVADITAVQFDIGQLQAGQSTLEAEVDANTASISAHAGQISVLQVTVSGFLTDTATLQNKTLDSSNTISNCMMIIRSLPTLPPSGQDRELIHVADQNGLFRYSSGNGWFRLIDYVPVTLDTTQTISGAKRFEAPIELKEQTTVADPPPGHYKIYPKSDGEIYKRDSDGNETQLGGSAGGPTPNSFNQYDLVGLGVISASTAATFPRAVAVVYNDTNSGIWRVRLNIRCNHGSDDILLLTISGLTFKSGSSFSQAVTVSNNSNSWRDGYAISNSSTIRITSGSNATQTSVSQDVELEAKPTWAI